MDRDDGRVWYLPHHGVYHARKPEKIRVVFDCAAVYRGISLNSVLLQGPDLTNNLLSILLKFREQPVALMADIEAMFYQVRVPKSDQDCLRFYWWPSGNHNKEPEVYKMVVHLFGAVSSPSCCNMALLKTAEANKDVLPAASMAIRDNFYVDDLLKSVESEEEALSLVQDLINLCQKGGFRLAKWVTNNQHILENIPLSEQSKGQKDLTFDKLPTERALGVSWRIQEDLFNFDFGDMSVVPTRRNILSVVCSIFDPLGLAAPYILPAKILLQDLCRNKSEWDAEISGTDLRRWQQWLYDLPKLKELFIDRCLKPIDFGAVSCIQLHYFADASEQGYGIVVYIRFTNREGRVHCQLLLSKARVAPSKKTTIPRMELTAATIAVKIHRKLQDLWNLRADLIFFWTDSMSVLRYINNETTRFHTFVANRITVIREGSECSQWKYVSSKQNPADCVSRGLSADELLKSQWWAKGPEFLWTPYPEWVKVESQSLLIPADDPEVKRVVHSTQVTQTTDSPIDDLLHRCSTWTKLRRVVAWVMTYINKLKFLVDKRRERTKQLSETEHDVAKLKILVDESMQSYTPKKPHQESMDYA